MKYCRNNYQGRSLVKEVKSPLNFLHVGGFLSAENVYGKGISAEREMG